MEDHLRPNVTPGNPASDPRYVTIAQRLSATFMDEEANDLRARLFDRLQDEAIAYGPPVMRVIVACVRAAKTARYPARYFAASVTRRLREQGFLEDRGDLAGPDSVTW
jgi:hypothetical protein